MALSKKIRQSLPLAKQNGNALKLRREMVAYKIGRTVWSADDELDTWRIVPDACEEFSWEGYPPGADEYYDPWEDCDFERDWPLVQLRQELDASVVNHSPFMLLAQSVGQAQREAPQIELTQKVSWYYRPGDAGSFDSGLLADHLRDYLSREDSMALQCAAKRLSHWSYTAQPFVELLLLFRPFWIRKPCTWTGSSKESLLRHLFTRYEVPSFLFAQWRDLDDSLDNRFVWNLWLIMIGQGVKLSRVFAELSKKYDQCLFRIPGEFVDHTGAPDAAASFAMAAEAIRIGASDSTVLRLSRNRAFLQSPMGMEPAFHEFFEGTVKWFEVHGEQLQEDEADAVLAWAYHLHSERLMELQRELWESHDNANQRIRLDAPECWQRHRKHPSLFNWRGRTANSARNAAVRYQRQLAILRETALFRRSGLHGFESWKSNGLDYSLSHGEDEWSIVELCSLRELVLEGDALSHCVATYAVKCLKGESAIFSLQLNGRRKVTIEISRASGRVLQARGMANRLANTIEREVIRVWSQWRKGQR